MIKPWMMVLGRGGGQFHMCEVPRHMPYVDATLHKHRFGLTAVGQVLPHTPVVRQRQVVG